MYQPTAELRALQLKCLEILNIVHEICVTHGIKYSLNGGSVVGAHLYKGFLPWDDDIDLMMTRDEYNKFIQLCPRMLPEGYQLINYETSKEYTTLFSKVINTRTTLIQKAGDKEIISGVFLDISCYDKVPEGWRSIPVKMVYYTMQWIYCTKKVHKPTHWKHYLQNLKQYAIGDHPTWFYQICQKLLEAFSKCKPYTYSELMYGHTIPFRPSVFENYTTILFEEKQYMIVRDYLEYLETRYKRTNFQEPEERQVPPHYVHVDLKLPYKEYSHNT